MKRFKNILAVVGDPAAATPVLTAAHDLATRNGAALTVLGIVDQPTPQEPIVLQDGTTMAVKDLLAGDLAGEIDGLISSLGFVATVEVVVGVGFIEVINHARNSGNDIVFVGGGGEVARRGQSSMVMHLLRKCPVPVWVETPRGDESPDVAVAVGPFLQDETMADLNQLLLQFATSLAEMRDGSLHVVHAWRLDGETQLRRARARQRSEYVDELVDTAYREADLNLGKLLDGFVDRPIRVERHLVKGMPGDVIPQMIDTIRPGVLVMGTLAHAGLRGLFIGNTAETVLSTVESSLMAVKPEGFEPPV